MRNRSWTQPGAGGSDASVADVKGPTTPGRGRRIRRLLVVGAIVGVLVSSLTACETTNANRVEVLNLINQSRAEAGLPALQSNLQLDVKADKWAQQLRNECNLYHSTLSDGVTYDWRKLGENVGHGGDIAQIHAAYLNSPGHRANIMDPQFNYVGTAAVVGTCNGSTRVYTVQVFMKL